MFKSKSPAKTLGHFNLPFHFPEISGKKYAPGSQPYSPGVSHADWPGAVFGPIPWPGVVPVLNTLSSNPGTPTGRAVIPVVNRYSPLPMNNLFIAGFTGKSIG